MSTKTIPAQLLALVERPRLDEKGKPAVKDDKPVMRKIAAKEVLGWRDHGDRVVMVTDDGQKFSADVPADVRKQLNKEAAAPAGAAS